MKKFKRAIRVVVALVLLAFVATQVEWGNMLGVAARAEPAWLAVAFLVSTLDRVFMAAKWRYLLGGLGVESSLREAVVYYYMGGLVGAALQWHLSGDIARAVGFGRRTNRHSLVTTSVVLEKVAGLQALTVLAAGSALLLNAQIGFVQWSIAWPFAVAAILVVGIGPFVVRFTAVKEVVVTRLEEWNRLERLKRAIRTLPEDLEQEVKGVYGWFLGLTLLEQLVPTLLLLIYTHAFDVDLGLLAILSVLPIITFLARLPISVESLGVMEGLFVFFLGLVGVGSATAFLLALVSRLMDLIVMGSGAFACSFTSEWNVARSGAGAEDDVVAGDG